jgi:hypothetical protein
VAALTEVKPLGKSTGDRIETNKRGGRVIRCKGIRKKEDVIWPLGGCVYLIEDK